MAKKKRKAYGSNTDLQERRDLFKELVGLQKEQGDAIKEQGPWMSKLLGIDTKMHDIEKDILILNQLVNDDGTITNININNFSKQEIKNILDNNIAEIFDKHLDEWLNKNMPKLLEKYFSKKEK